ncbi:hypothetical protein PGIGA_G00032710 [Pangasianodon gigas]|uniref:Uncharacterized protein n=1 Tax=Pangasianodon gigas TaxID=30993 RepID=A0ACC5WZ44_PANGG|nr:hypothetical protein [Pangasianodon gigas]
MEGEIKEGRKIQFSVPSAGPIQLDPRQVEMIRRRRPTPATLFCMTDHPSPEEENHSFPLFVCENGVSKSQNIDMAIYQPPSLKAVQKMAQAHIKSSDTPSSESSDNEDVSLDAPRAPPDKSKSNQSDHQSVYESQKEEAEEKDKEKDVDERGQNTDEEGATDPPDEIKSEKSECPLSSGRLGEEEKGKEEAENLRAESTENRESEEKGEE